MLVTGGFVAEVRLPEVALAVAVAVLVVAVAAVYAEEAVVGGTRLVRAPRPIPRHFSKCGA